MSGSDAVQRLVIHSRIKQTTLRPALNLFCLTIASKIRLGNLFDMFSAWLEQDSQALPACAALIAGDHLTAPNHVATA